MIVRTKEINLTVVVENFLIRKEMSQDRTEKAIVENVDIVGTAVRKVMEDHITMTDIVLDEINIEETLETDTKNLEEGGQESGPAVANTDTIVGITKSKFHEILDSIFLGDTTQVILKEIDVIIKVVEDAVIHEIESTQGGKENLTFTLTSKRRHKLILFQTSMNMATNYFGMVSSGSARFND